MTFTSLDWVIFLSVPLIAWVLAQTSGRPRGVWGYFWARGRLSTASVAATFFGTNLTFTSIFLILSEEADKRGLVVLAIPLFWIVGTVLFVIAYPRLQPFFERGLTLHQALGEAFSSRTIQKWASAWTIAAFIGTIALEFYGGVRLLQWVNVPLLADVTLALLLAFVVSAFTVSGGLKGVARADIVLDGFTILATALLVVLAWPLLSQGLPESPTAVPPSPADLGDSALFVIGAAALFLPFQFCTLDTWQRLGAWEGRKRSPRTWLLTGSVLLAIAYCVPILVGATVRNEGIVVSADGSPLRTLLEQLRVGPILMGLIFAGFLAAIFSTADELLNAAAMTMIFDLLGVQRSDEGRSGHGQARLYLSGQLYTSAFALASAIAALAALRFEREISDLAVAVFSSQVVFTVPLLVVLLAPRSAPRLARPAIASMLTAFGVALLLVAVGWVTDDSSWGSAAPVAAFACSGLILGIAVLRDGRRVRGAAA